MARIALLALTVVLGLFACVPGGHVEAPVQPRVSGDLATVLTGAELAQYRDTPAGGNRLGDTAARADDYSRLAAELASETGMAPINDVARRVRYNGAYFEVDVEVNGEGGIVPVTWEMLRAHTPLVSQAYYARVYASRGWANGRQVPSLGPDVILPEAFTPELTPVLFEYLRRSFISWNRNFNGWTQAMADAWLKSAAIHVAQVWTPEFVGGVAIASARASQITGRMALGAAAVPNAAAAVRACSGGRCPPVAAMGANRFVGPKVFTNRHGQLTNGRYILDEAGMAPHTTGSIAKGKSQFLYGVNEKQLTLDAAAYADGAGLWVGNKAKVVLDDFIGVHAGTGQRTQVLNIYRTDSGFIHAAPGSPL